MRAVCPWVTSRGLAPQPRPAWWPAWSEAAALRTLRAVLVVPPLFALTYEGFGNLQMALFAAFGGFASLIFAAFGGTRRDKLVAHFTLAVIGSVALIIGTAVSGITWLAVVVTIPVAFGIFFAGVAGPNAASGVTAALLPYVLPVATPGGVSTIPDRLAGWWLASAVSTAVVLALPTPSPGDRLRAAAARSARTLAAHLAATARGTVHGRGPRGLPRGQEPADERVRQHAVPAGRPSHGRPGHVQPGPDARVVHRAGRRRHRGPSGPGPGRAGRP